MQNELFSVEMIAGLCDVNLETVRRWRKWGRNGIKLEAVDPEAPELTFTAEALTRFLNANPKYLTESMRQELERKQQPVAPSETALEALKDNYVYNLLKEKRDLLSQQLKELEKELNRMEKEAEGK